MKFNDVPAVFFVALALVVVVIQATFQAIASSRPITPSQKYDLIEAWLNTPQMLKAKADALAKWKASHPKLSPKPVVVKVPESCEFSDLCP